MVHGFETYLTGFPLKDISVYALGRTWYAPEMERPGCVWTHTLLIAKEDLAYIPDITVLLKPFKRPQKKLKKEMYSLAIPIPFDKLAPSVDRRGSSLRVSSSVLSALYGETGKPVFIPADNSEEYKDLSLAIWGQQWPRLRYSFCFCTGSIASRQVDGKVFDLQVISWKSVRKAKREVPSGVFLDHDNLSLSSDQPSWAIIAARDLVDTVPSENLRKFLWYFGEGQLGGRAAFCSLVETRADLNAVNERKLSLEEFIERIAYRFPDSKEAMLLKATILDGRKHEDRWLYPSMSERDLLKALSETKCSSAFDKKTLDIRQRAQRFWQTSPSEAIQIITELFGSEVNPLGEEYILGVAKSLEPADVVGISKINRALLYVFVKHKPALAGNSKLWQVSADEQRELLDAVLSSVDLGVDTMRNVVIAILESGSDSIADEIVPKFGSIAVITVLDWVDSCPSASFDMFSDEWRYVLRSHQSELLEWVQRAASRTEFGMAFAADLLDPNSAEVIRAGAKVWLPLARNAASNLEDDILIKTMSFLLALALNNPGGGSAELAEHSFQIVHDSAQNGTLGYSSWRMLEKNVPQLGWWQDWDKCERLRRALVESFIRYQWSIGSFLLSVKSPEIFKEIVYYCRRTRKGRALIRDAARCLASGTIQASEYQEKLLSRYV
jgi:hypothetical protein